MVIGYKLDINWFVDDGQSIFLWGEGGWGLFDSFPTLFNGKHFSPGEESALLGLELGLFLPTLYSLRPGNSFLIS